jgi:hypothetical protein
MGHSGLTRAIGGAGAVDREFVGAVLGPGHPCGDIAVLLVSELFGNARGARTASAASRTGSLPLAG